MGDGHRTHLVKAIGPLASPTLVLWGDRKGRIRQASVALPTRPQAMGRPGPLQGELRPGSGRVCSSYSDPQDARAAPHGAAAGPTAEEWPRIPCCGHGSASSSS